MTSPYLNRPIRTLEQARLDRARSEDMRSQERRRQILQKMVALNMAQTTLSPRVDDRRDLLEISMAALFGAIVGASVATWFMS